MNLKIIHYYFLCSQKPTDKMQKRKNTEQKENKK